MIPGGEAWLDRYSRQIMLDQIGYEGQKRLAESTALVVGAGGLGTVVLERLAGMGVGRVVVVDRDVIEASNLHRQTLYGDADVGRGKAEAAVEKMGMINGGVKATPVAAPITAENAGELVGGCDVAIDALDTARARYILNSACIDAGVPLVSGSAVGVEGQAMTVLPGNTACYRCVFGSVDDDAMPKCSTTGVHPSILSIIGGVEASEAAAVMAGREPALAGRLFHANLDGLEFAKMGVHADPECPACGSGRGDGDAAAGTAARAADGRRCLGDELVVEELCGRGRGKRTFAVSGCTCSACDGHGRGGAAWKCAGGDADGGGIKVTVVGASCAIVVGASSADDARKACRRHAVSAASAAGDGARPGPVHGAAACNDGA